MTYTEVSFSLKPGLKKIVLTQELVLVLNEDSQKYSLHKLEFYVPYFDNKGFSFFSARNKMLGVCLQS